MRRYFNIINQVLVVLALAILLSVAAVAQAGSGVDPLLSPLPTSQESEPRVTLAPPPEMPTQAAPVVPQSAGHSAVAPVAEPVEAVEAVEGCASCMTVEVTLCDGQVITLSVQRIEVK